MATRRFFSSIRSHILLLLALTFVVMLGMAGYFAHYDRQRDVAAATAIVLQMAERIVDEQSEIIASTRQLLTLLTETRDIAEFGPTPRCQQLLAQIIKREPRLANIYFAAPNGDIICNATLTPLTINIADRAYFSKALTSSEPIIEQANVGRSTGKWNLPFAEAIRNDAGQVQGVLVVALDLHWVAKEFSKAKLPKGARIGLIDNKGNVLVREPDPEKLVGKNVAHIPFFKTLIKHGGTGTAEEQGYDDVRRVFGFAHFAETTVGPIYLWVGVSRDSVLADVDREYALTAVGVLITLSLAFGAIWLGSDRLFVRPITAMVTAARRLARGDHQARTGVSHTDDELGELASSFDAMATALMSKSEIFKLNRALRTLSKCNEALIHAESEIDLLNEICRIVVEMGGYRMAWVGFAEHDEGKTMRPMAQNGFEEGYLTNARITWADVERGRGPTGTAIRTGAPQFNQNFLTNPLMAPWRDEALKHGYQSSAALPLKENTEVFGVLAIYAQNPDAFTADEQVLMEELADNLAFGIAALRTRAERERAELKIRRLNRIEAVLSGINSLIVRVENRQQLFDGACRIAVGHGGFGIAWIGLLEPDTMNITPAARAGIDTQSFLLIAPATAQSDPLLGQGEISRALREKRIVFSNDLTIEPEVGSKFRKEAIRCGYRSAIALPLLMEDTVVGALNLFAKEPNYFDADELKLLIELAGDISFALDHLAKKEKVNYLAYYDVLTGLANHALFTDRVNQHLHQSKQTGRMVALLLLDIERFRNISDTLGRNGSDTILKLIGQRLAQTVGEQSSLARVGSDVFAFTVGVIEGPAEIAHFAEEKINDCFSRPFHFGDQELRISARLGIAISPADGSDADTLYKNAEMALLKAKEVQEQYLFYARDMNARIAETLSTENKLRKAVEEQQFILHYQPKFNSKTGAIVGMEALIRWNDPATGLVPPIKFISILEETGLILPVGAWAMKEAVNQYRRWREQGLNPPRIAVNVSAIQLRRKDFVSAVKEAIRFSSNDDHGLDLEITESLIMTNIEDNVAKLKVIRQLGSRIAIDDFGTGYSSLQYLSQLPVDSLKIDRSFVVRMTNGAADRAIVLTIIELAHNLDLKVIAEGVDSEEQAKLLRLLNCNEMQGYLFSKPLPGDQIQALLHNSQSVAVGRESN